MITYNNPNVNPGFIPDFILEATNTEFIVTDVNTRFCFIVAYDEQLVQDYIKYPGELIEQIFKTCPDKTLSVFVRESAKVLIDKIIETNRLLF